MPIDKISDDALREGNRYHVTQLDVPGMSAADMKEFMDYIPRMVIIPKINEIIDETENKASRSEIESAVAGKADIDSVFTKNEVNWRLESKANVGDSYLKAQADALLAQKAASSDVQTALSSKANAADVYTKNQSVKLFSNILKGNQTGACVFANDILAGNVLDVRVHSTAISGYKISDITDASHFLKCGYQSAQDIKAYLDGLSESEWKSNKIVLYTVSFSESTPIPCSVYIEKSAGTYKLIEDVGGEAWGNGSFSLSDFAGGSVTSYGIDHYTNDGITLTSYGLWLLLGQIPDYSSVTVKRFIGNIVNIPDIETTGQNASMTSYIQWYIDLPVGTKITVSCDYKGTGSGGAKDWRIKLTDNTTIKLFEFQGVTVPSRTSYTHTKTVDFTLSDVSYSSFYFIQANQDGNYAKNITVNIGSEDMGYAPYSEPTVYTANADGTVSGITPAYSNSAFITIANNMEILFGYDRDINIVLKKIENAISGLGGTV